MSRIADIALTAWILFVAVAYFGGYFLPQIGESTAVLVKVYAGMLIAAVLFVCLRWLLRKPGESEA